MQTANQIKLHFLESPTCYRVYVSELLNCFVSVCIRQLVSSAELSADCVAGRDTIRDLFPAFVPVTVNTEGFTMSSRQNVNTPQRKTIAECFPGLYGYIAQSDIPAGRKQRRTKTNPKYRFGRNPLAADIAYHGGGYEG